MLLTDTVRLQRILRSRITSGSNRPLTDVARLRPLPLHVSAHFQIVSAPRSCTRDEGRSLGAGLQERASNHLKLLWSNARVVSVKEKAPRKESGEVQGGERKRSTDEVSK